MANENPYHESKTRKYVKTACLCLAFLSLGLIMALPGPALPTLAYNIGIEIDAISFIFPSRAVGYLIGSIVSGVLHGKLDTYKMIGFSLMMTAIGFTSAPFFSSVILLAIAMTSMGISMGFLDTGGNVLCLEIWGDESGPFMQALHFSFALGATTAPFLAQPFIMEVVDTNTTTNMTTAAMINNFTAVTELSTTAVPPVRPGFPYVAWAFIICGSLTIMISIAFLYLSFSKRSKAASKQEN
uniref:Major facilitator superfamily (MFS) profile domain-containing protein n=1 Tax=Ciona savignyi TaxID=51511 RepID=H2Y4Q0_CIOSA